MSYNNKYIWNANGHELHIQSMTSHHLKTTIRKLRRMALSATDMKFGHTDDGTLSVLSVDEYLESTVPQYEFMLMEAFRRNIPDSELIEQVNRDESQMA